MTAGNRDRLRQFRKRRGSVAGLLHEHRMHGGPLKGLHRNWDRVPIALRDSAALPWSTGRDFDACYYRNAPRRSAVRT